jgi:hypothetical protein
MKIWPAKDPAEVLDYTWTVPLDTGDTIANVTAVKSSGSAEIDNEANTDTTLQLWLSGGTADELSKFTLTAMTNGGRTFREVGVLPVIDRASDLIASFRLRYPAFDALDDGRISYWLADAGPLVASWAADSQETARLAWSAHNLAASGALSAGVDMTGMTSFKSGDFSASFADKIASQQGLESTPYGREFIALRRASFAGPRLAWQPPAVPYVC